MNTMIDESLIRRFNTKWRESENDCWLWTGSIAGKGYGSIKATRSRRWLYAHRLSWEIANGPLPEGANVLHRCDTPACVNPAHLFIGSKEDNAQDMKAKDRHLYGVRNSEAKLTDAGVLQIYAWSDKGWSQHRIADHFGLSQGTVFKILHGQRWAHLFKQQRRGNSDPA